MPNHPNQPSRTSHPDKAGQNDSPCPTLDIIIVNYNSTDEALACIESIHGNLETGAEIFLVDNASADNPERIAQIHPGVHLILNRENLGFGKAVNQGLKAGRSPWVMLLNPDTHIPEPGVCRIWEYLRQNPDVGVVGPLILDPDGTVQGSARGFHSLVTAFAGRKGILSRLFPNSRPAQKDLPAQGRQGGGPLTVDWVSGACMLLRREVADRVGGMDERFFMYFEDTDWCRRMKAAGYDTVYHQGFSVVHQVGASSGGRPLATLWSFHKSCYLYLGKYWLRKRPWAAPLAAAAVGFRFLLLAGMRLARLGLERLRGNRR